MTAKLPQCVAALILGSVFLGPVSSLMAAEPSPGATHHERGQRFQQWLGLTDDQMTAIREIRQREAPAARQHFQAVRQAQIELRQAVLNGADDATIQAKAANVQNLLAQGVDLRVRRLQEIAPILTPEQRQKLTTASFQGRGPRRHHPRSGESWPQQ